MINKIILGLLWLSDYLIGRLIMWLGYLWGKGYQVRQRWSLSNQGTAEITYLREEVRRLRFANSVMRQELNRVKTKRPCLCKKLKIIYFKLRFNISCRKIKRYLPISKTTVMRYLNQLKSGISNLAPRVRSSFISPYRTPVSIASLIWEIHRENSYWGRWKIAFAIWKIGVYVSPSTVRNILNAPEPDYRRPEKKDEKPKMRAINGKYPNHIWSIDLTTIYIWLKPLYILAVIDQFSRKAMILTSTFHPTAEWTINQLKEITLKYGNPKHLISDKGPQFKTAFKTYVKQQGIYHRYACISKANGNSKVERFFRSLKYEFLNLYLFFSKNKVDGLLKEYLTYYNEYRPHEGLGGRIPNERYTHRPRDKPDKNDKAIKGPIERIEFAAGLLRAYQLKKDVA
jgi:transposase InsO family protein